MRREALYARVATSIGACAWTAAGFYPGENPDTYGHLALGRQMLELGGVPKYDSWSLLEPARVYRNYEWFADLLFAALHRSFGYDALFALKAVLVISAVGLIGAFARKLGGARAELLTAVALLAALPVARMRLSDRPHLFAFPLVALYLLGCASLCDERGAASRRRWIALLGVAHVLWVNVHGSHLLGLTITASFLACAAGSRRTFGALFGVQLLACCISPYGPLIVIEALEHTLDPRYRNLVSEWQPWSEDTPAWMQLGPVLHAALLAPLAPRLFRRVELRGPLLIALGLGVLAFRSQRFVADFVFVLSPLLGIAYAPLLARVRERAAVGGSLAALAALCVAVPTTFHRLPPYASFGFGETTLDRPAVAGDTLALHGGGAGGEARVFAALEDSWYLEYRAPRARYYVDGRVPFFGAEHVARANAALRDPRLFELERRRYSIDAVVVRHTSPNQARLVAHLERHPHFKLAAIELHHALFVRNDLARRAGFPALSPLAPGFRIAFALEADEPRRAALQAALASIPDHENTRAYRGWVEALLALAPFSRGTLEEGLRTPATATEMAVFRRALPQLALAAEQTDAASVRAFHGLVAALACDLEAAERSLTVAFRTAPTPLVLFALQELALRRGERRAVETFLASVPASPRNDRWLAALREQLRAPPACAPPSGDRS